MATEDVDAECICVAFVHDVIAHLHLLWLQLQLDALTLDVRVKYRGICTGDADVSSTFCDMLKLEGIDGNVQKGKTVDSVILLKHHTWKKNQQAQNGVIMFWLT